MKKKPIPMEWSNMTGFGPRAWDRDEKKLSIHTPHHESEHHHIVRRKPQGHANTQEKNDTDP